MLRLMIAGLLAPAALAASGGIAATVTVGSAACGILAQGRYLYADSYNGGGLAKVDPATNKVVKRVRGLGNPCGLAGGGNAVWVEDYTGNRILRIGLKRFRVTNRIRVGRHPWDVAFAFGSVWATNEADGTVSRIDPKTRKVVKTISAGGAPACVRAGGDALWVGTQTGSVYRIDPATNAAQEVPVPGSSSTLCVDPEPDGIWVVNNLDSTVTVLDPSDYHVLHRIDLPERPTDAVRGADGTEWVASRLGGSVSRIDPQSGKVVDTIATGGQPFVIRAGFGDVWTADYSGTALWRLHVSP
ncbi:MAG TPA: YncE family protein [Gaiellaceae bacterium]|nr:YncE family protein [Gaiellaceae bacterium]